MLFKLFVLLYCLMLDKVGVDFYWGGLKVIDLLNFFKLLFLLIFIKF